MFPPPEPPPTQSYTIALSNDGAETQLTPRVFREALKALKQSEAGRAWSVQQFEDYVVHTKTGHVPEKVTPMLGRFMCSTEPLQPAGKEIQYAGGLYLYWIPEDEARSIALDWCNTETKKRVVANSEEAARILLCKFDRRDGKMKLTSSAELQLFDLWALNNKMVEVKPAVYPLAYIAALGAPVWAANGIYHTTFDAETVVTEPRTLENLMTNFEYIRETNDRALAERAAEKLSKMDFKW